MSKINQSRILSKDFSPARRNTCVWSGQWLRHLDATAINVTTVSHERHSKSGLKVDCKKRI